MTEGSSAAAFLSMLCQPTFIGRHHRQKKLNSVDVTSKRSDEKNGVTAAATQCLSGPESNGLPYI